MEAGVLFVLVASGSAPFEPDGVARSDESGERAESVGVVFVVVEQCERAATSLAEALAIAQTVLPVNGPTCFAVDRVLALAIVERSFRLCCLYATDQALRAVSVGPEDHTVALPEGDNIGLCECAEFNGGFECGCHGSVLLRRIRPTVRCACLISTGRQVPVDRPEPVSTYSASDSSQSMIDSRTVSSLVPSANVLTYGPLKSSSGSAPQ